MLSPQWRELLKAEQDKPYFSALEKFVDEQYASEDIFPPRESIFRAMDLCSPSQVKVVIIGQDPYHNVSQANGLCFSVSEGVKFPPSLRNIFKEIHDDLGTEPPLTGELTRWAEQGVLMLNAVLTVKAHNAGSHAGKGWEKFTDAVIRALSDSRTGVVYMLWGSYAQGKCKVVDPAKNLILQSVHPSPLSAYRGFFGCKHFSLANAYLSEPVLW